jgi:hypothetical protein
MIFCFGDGLQTREMQCRGGLVHYSCRLSPAVAIRAVEIHCVAAMLREMAF